MTKRTSFYLLRVLLLLPALAAPAFAKDGKEAPGGPGDVVRTMSPTHPDDSELTPFPPQWWKDN